MYHIQQQIIALKGWRRYALAMLCGVFATAALPPLYILPLLWLAFPGLLLLLEKTRTPRQAFWTGWAFGFGHHVSGLYWIANSLLVEPEKFAWLIPFAVSFIPAALAVYIGLVALALFYITQYIRLQPWAKVILFSCLWVAAEMLRGVLFTGFPWNAIGYVWTVSDAMVQLAAITGVYGLSLVTVWVASTPFLFPSQQWKPLATACIVLLILWCGGALRMAVPIQSDAPETLPVRIVQGNIAQHYKWDPVLRSKTVSEYITLSLHDSGLDPEKPAFLLWPETAVPFVLNENPAILEVIAEEMPDPWVVATGAMRSEGEGATMRIWNSFFAINGKGEIEGAYDKVRLVPFGEYVPFRQFFPFVNKITHGSLDFSAGEAFKVLTPKNIPAFSPLICYEVIFPDAIAKEQKKAAFLVTVTNDAWFGNSSGPYQHYAMAKLRAVEQGVPLLRAANTGISGAFDAYGRELLRIELSEKEAKNINLPLVEIETFYTIWKYKTLVFLMTIMSIFAVLKGRVGNSK